MTLTVSQNVSVYMYCMIQFSLWRVMKAKYFAFNLSQQSDHINFNFEVK